jgi:glycosyltransferase involved in cell wall biosynthesis
MHILYVHRNFPAQFGHVAAALAGRLGFQCTFVSELPPGHVEGIERIQYRLEGGATAATHFCSRTFENAIWHSHAVYKALVARPDVQPDLVVGHSGFLTTTFLRELYDCPFINYFEFYYHPHGSDLDFRPDQPTGPLHYLRARARNATFLLDLESCDAGYSPTHWQRDRLPACFRPRVRVLFDGLDTSVWRPQTGLPRRVGELVLPPGIRLVTYVARGFEAMRGFDIFMKVARRLCQARADVVFAVVGQDKVFYGGDLDHTGGKSFKEWVLAQDSYDLSRILFLGTLPPPDLAALLAVSDLHIYLSVPFVLSWSLLNALACGAVVLASDTAPVREVIAEGSTGLLAGFFDVDGLVARALQVLDRPADFKPLGAAGVELIRQRYSMEVCLPQHIRFYDEVTGAGR